MEYEEGFSVHVTVHIDPSNVDKYFEYFRPAYDAVIAEPECTFFEVYQSAENPGELHWQENWCASSLSLLTFYAVKADISSQVKVSRVVPAGASCCFPLVSLAVSLTSLAVSSNQIILQALLGGHGAYVGETPRVPGSRASETIFLRGLGNIAICPV